MITYLFSYFMGNRLIFKNNRIRKRFESTPYVEGINILSLIIAAISSVFLTYYEIDLICCNKIILIYCDNILVF